METDQTVISTNEHSLKSYLLFWIGQLFSLFGSQIVVFAIGVWITIEYENITLMAITMLVSFVPSLILTPITGVFADKFNKKKILIISDFLQAVFTIILIMFFAFSLGNIVILFIIMGLRGFCQAFQIPTASTILPLLIKKENLSRMNGLNFLFNAIIQIISPIVAALLIDSGLKIDQILWVDVITFVTAVLLILKIKIPKVKKTTEFVDSPANTEETEKNSFIRDFKDGISVIKNIKGLISMMILSLFINFLITPISMLQSFFILITHNGSVLDLATFSAFFGFGFFVGAILVSIKKEWKRKIFITFGGISLIFAGIVVLGLVPVGESWSIWFMSTVGFLIAWTLPVINTVMMTIMQKVVPHDKLGRVNSIDRGVSSAITPIGYILSAPIANIIGVRMLFIISGVLGIIVTLLGLVLGNLSLYRIEDNNIENFTDTLMQGIENEVVAGGESTMTAYVEKKKIDESGEFD